MTEEIRCVIRVARLAGRSFSVGRDVEESCEERDRDRGREIRGAGKWVARSMTVTEEGRYDVLR